MNVKQWLCAGIICLVASVTQGAVYDNANMFSNSAQRDAETKFQQIQNKTGVEVVVETIPRSDRTNFANESDKNRYFQDLLKECADARGARGVYVLICKTPGRVQVDFHKNLFQRGIALSSTSSVRDAALQHLKQKNPDRALAAMADSLESLFLAVETPKPVEVPVQPQIIIHDVRVERVPAPAPVVVEQAESHMPGFLIFVLVVGGIVMVGAIIWYCQRDEVQEVYTSTYTPPKPVKKPSTVDDLVQERLQTPPTVVNVQQSSVDPLLAGVAGYAIGSMDRDLSSRPYQPNSPPAPPVSRPEPSHKSRRRDDDDDNSSSSSSGFSFGGGSSSNDDSGYSGGSGGDFGGGGDSGGFDGGSGGDF